MNQNPINTFKDKSTYGTQYNGHTGPVQNGGFVFGNVLPTIGARPQSHVIGRVFPGPVWHGLVVVVLLVMVVTLAQTIARRRRFTTFQKGQGGGNPIQPIRRQGQKTAAKDEQHQTGQNVAGKGIAVLGGARRVVHESC